MSAISKISVLICIFAAPGSSAEPFPFDTDKAYLLIKATVSDESAPQPTWIALSKRVKLLHVPASDLIVELPPGTYTAQHIDFEKSSKSGNGTKILENSKRWKLEAGNVYLAGHLVLSNLKSRKYTIELGDRVALITAACAKAPEFFKHFPLTDFGPGPGVMVPCDELLNEKTGD